MPDGWIPVTFRADKGRRVGRGELGTARYAPPEEVPVLADVTWGPSGEGDEEGLFTPSGAPTFTVTAGPQTEKIRDSWDAFFQGQRWNIQEIRPFTPAGSGAPNSKLRIRCGQPS